MSAKNIKPEVKEHKAGKNKNVKGTLLVYTGSLKNSFFDLTVGIHIEISPDVGIRYETVIEREDRVMTHVALFYKFSYPDQSITYNYLTRSSTIHKRKNAAPGFSDKEFIVIGKEKIDNYVCTHLHHENDDEDNKAIADYWMSTDLPGYNALAKALSGSAKEDPNQKFIPLSGSLFEYGALVRMTTKSSGKNPMSGGNSIIDLKEVNTNMSFPESDFEVPKK